jgi:sugar phosphate isomerase/epimerase
VFAISTCWKSPKAETGADIIGPILDAGFNAVELEYRITDEIFQEMLPLLKRGEPAVVSVHNFFPVPPGLSRDKAGGDAFLLCSPDKEQRGLALRYTIRTLEHAHELGASAVVLHLGKTDMDDGFSRLKEANEAGTLTSKLIRTHIQALLKERKEAKRTHLDAALFSLDKLWRPAERLSIRLGIENRYSLKEVPDSHELRVIFERFGGSGIGYWHDVGHAAVQEFFYDVSHEELLGEFSPHLVGIHLHDAEAEKDHQPPGTGKVDFAMVRKYIRSDTIRVIEVSSDVSEKDLKGGADFLSRHEVGECR